MNADNWVGLQPNGTAPSSIQSASAFAISVNGSSVITQSAADAYETVLNLAGASLSRDAVDKRIVNDVRKGTAEKGNKGIIDSQTQVGGWPEYKEEVVKDSDSDGMPNWFEDQFGLSNSNPNDTNAITLDKNGRYTNLEMYLHYLVKDIVAGQYQ